MVRYRGEMLDRLVALPIRIIGQRVCDGPKRAAAARDLPADLLRELGPDEVGEAILNDEVTTAGDERAVREDFSPYVRGVMVGVEGDHRPAAGDPLPDTRDDRLVGRRALDDEGHPRPRVRPALGPLDVDRDHLDRARVGEPRRETAPLRTGLDDHLGPRRLDDPAIPRHVVDGLPDTQARVRLREAFLAVEGRRGRRHVEARRRHPYGAPHASLIGCHTKYG